MRATWAALPSPCRNSRDALGSRRPPHASNAYDISNTQGGTRSPPWSSAKRDSEQAGVPPLRIQREADNPTISQQEEVIRLRSKRLNGNDKFIKLPDLIIRGWRRARSPPPLASRGGGGRDGMSSPFLSSPSSSSISSCPTKPVPSACQRNSRPSFSSSAYETKPPASQHLPGPGAAQKGYQKKPRHHVFSSSDIHASAPNAAKRCRDALRHVSKIRMPPASANLPSPA